MIRVLVRLFASYREAAGVGHIDLDLPEGSRVRDAVSRIQELHPLVGGGRAVALIARDREYVDADATLGDGDELALIPPVSGGAAGSVARIAIGPDPISVDDAVEAVRGPAFGGIAVFLGTVRDESRGKRVTHLEYEAYAEMAERRMREIADRLESEHAPARVAMHHRTGDLRIGDVAVIVAAAAPHRDAAFAAARAAIDLLKRDVPIWKKEHTEDGAVWIEEHA
jgi:molybdopterin synthase catalytic subunit